jgi:hypothetical protein
VRAVLPLPPWNMHCGRGIALLLLVVVKMKVFTMVIEVMISNFCTLHCITDGMFIIIIIIIIIIKCFECIQQADGQITFQSAVTICHDM